MECKICLEKFEKANKLSLHINKHNISKIEYYNRFLIKENEGICYCGNSCKFISITLGYHKYCSTKCLSNDPNIKEKIKEKVSGEKHWLHRGGIHPSKGKSYEEIHGEEKAKKLKNKLNELGKKLTGEKNNFYGKTHSEENKEKFRINRLNKKYEEIYGFEKAKIIKNKLRKENVKGNFRDYFSEYPLKFYDHKYRLGILLDQKCLCPICNKDIKKKGSKNLHHINYVKKDNRRRNLIYLCVSCHSKTNSNRDSWKGNLRNINKHFISNSRRNKK